MLPHLAMNCGRCLAAIRVIAAASSMTGMILPKPTLGGHIRAPNSACRRERNIISNPLGKDWSRWYLLRCQ